MALANYEKETIILYNEEQSTASVCTYNDKLKNKLADYASKSSECCLRKQSNGYLEYTIPKSWIKIYLPRQYSEEQRQKMAERARNNLTRR